MTPEDKLRDYMAFIQECDRIAIEILAKHYRSILPERNATKNPIFSIPGNVVEFVICEN